VQVGDDRSDGVEFRHQLIHFTSRTRIRLPLRTTSPAIQRPSATTACVASGGAGALIVTPTTPGTEPFNAEVRALAPEERVAAVAASLESVWP
jgi:hypothetical protein